MPSQFFGLNISYTGLTTANAGLNTTSNNIANEQTEGYSRQVNVQEANRALRTFTTYGSAGAGVDTVAIERMRDEFYDTKYWDNNEKIGETNAKAYYMKTIENDFMDTDKINGFNTSFNLMYNALEELAKNAGDTSTKAQFVMYAQSLCDYFNGLSNQLTELQKDVNMEIKDTTSQINSIAEQISTLNKQINVIELTGAEANGLRDKRALLIDELSTYVSVETIETPIFDTNNSYDTGANRFMVKIAGGGILVDTNDYNELICTPREPYENVNQSDGVGLYEITWSNAADFDMYNPLMGGKLQGLIEMRDGNNTEYFNGRVSKVEDDGEHVNVTTTLDYLNDLDKCTLPKSGRIKLGVQEFYYSDWEFTYDPATNTSNYRFKIDNNYGKFTLTKSREHEDAKIGRSIDYQGIPYYQEQLNEFVRLFAKNFNAICRDPNAVDSYGNPSTILFKANAAAGDANQMDFNDYYANGPYTMKTEDPDITSGDPYYDSYYLLTAANFAVSDEIAKDPGKFATRTIESDGVSKYDLVNRMLALKDDASLLKSDCLTAAPGFRGGSASEFLQSVLSDVALNAARANASVKYYETMEGIIGNQRISVMGVDADEEAVNLIRYQNSYNLASKMISTFTEIYDKLILDTGV